MHRAIFRAGLVFCRQAGAVRHILPKTHMRLVRPLFLHARNDVGFPRFFPLFPARCQVGTMCAPIFSARHRVGLPHLPARRQVGFPPSCPSHVSPVRPRLRPSRPPCSRTADLLTARYPPCVCPMSRQGTPPFCPCPCRAPRLHRLSRPMPRRRRPCPRLRPRRENVPKRHHSPTPMASRLLSSLGRKVNGRLWPLTSPIL